MCRVLILKADGTMEDRVIESNVEDELLEELLNGKPEELMWFTQFEEKNIAVLQNENSKIEKLEPTVHVVKDRALVDVLCGNILFVGIDDEWYVGLDDFQMKYIKDNIKSASISLPTPFLIMV